MIKGIPGHYKITRLYIARYVCEYIQRIYKVTNKHLNSPPLVPSTIHAEVLILWVFSTQLINVRDLRDCNLHDSHMIWNNKSLLHLFSSLHLIKARIVNHRISCFFFFFTSTMTENHWPLKNLFILLWVCDHQTCLLH